MRIAMLAPPWIPIPAPGYGGIEEVVRLLCGQLVVRGHDVTLFAAPGSHSRAVVRSVLEDDHPDEIERALWEVDHVARVFEMIDDAAAAGLPYDLVHDHCGFTALAMADRLQTPIVHTVHGPFVEGTLRFYAVHGHKATLVALSASQRATGPPDLRDVAVVPNPTAVEEWPFHGGVGDHLLWIGRIEEVKGPHRAIAAARSAGVPLVIAGPVQPGQEAFFAREIEPHLDRDGVRYVGEVGAEDKKALFAGARGLLMPIRWAEPFGLVMIEAMACGTPVIAFSEGAAVEIVLDGQTGFLVDDEPAMVAAIDRLDEIDRARCRESVRERFDVSVVARGYEAVYARALRGRRGRFGPRVGASPPPRAPRAPAPRFSATSP